MTSCFIALFLLLAFVRNYVDPESNHLPFAPAPQSGVVAF